MTANLNQTNMAHFTCRINVDASNQVIHVDTKDRDDGVILSFASFREQVSALRELAKIAKVIVPKDSDLAAASFKTELKVRSNKLTDHEKLARQYASLTTHIPSNQFFKEECSKSDANRYQEALTQGRRFADARLKIVNKEKQDAPKRMSRRLNKLVETSKASETPVLEAAEA